MVQMDVLVKNLRERGFTVSHFASGQEAADYLDGAIDGVSVGIGGSMTVKGLGLYERLSAHNQVHWHWEGGALPAAATAEVYLTSANALAQTGELVNIDGNCNRISASVFGHQKVYFLVGRNKIAPDFEGAMWRARNVAAPRRAQSMGKKTPCAVHADKCYDCRCPDRVCRGLSVVWAPPGGVGEVEVVLVDQDLGL